jgi:hypothetical protein
MHFRCEAFNKDGKTVDLKYFNISVGGVTDASKDERVEKMKKKANREGFGFRVKMEED